MVGSIYRCLLLLLLFEVEVRAHVLVEGGEGVILARVRPEKAERRSAQRTG